MELILIYSIFTFIPSLWAADVCVEITAKFANVAPDGVAKEIITLNDKFPGPTIRANIGDTVHIRFINRLKNRRSRTFPMSIHFHGIEQIHTTWMDGPAQVTQCPIAYNRNMVYSFQIHQSGTYWYHSHHSWQYIDGFWGFLIVDNKPTEVHKYDDEILLSLTDWQWQSGELLTNLLHLPTTNSTPGAGQIPTPDSTLINGRGNANCTKAAGYTPKLICDFPTTQKMTVFKVTEGLTYRMRVLNPSAQAAYNFSIDGHKLRTIELDGVDLEDPKPVDKVTIYPAQRYSFLVTMDNPQKAAWIRAEMVMNFADPEVISKIKPLAALQYNLPDEDPASNQLPGKVYYSRGGGTQGRPATPYVDLNIKGLNITLKPANVMSLGVGEGCRRYGYKVLTENLPKNQITMSVNDVTIPTSPTSNPEVFDQTKCKAISKPGEVSTAPTLVDREVTLNVTVGYNDEEFFESRVNGDIFNVEDSKLPAIFRITRMQSLPNHFVPFDLPAGKNVQIVINNINGGRHPWHMHGHTFWVVGAGEPDAGPYDAARDASKLNLNRLRRDTTVVQPKSWLVVRFNTDNPGVWLLHCHINWHLERGMGAVFVEGPEIFSVYKIPLEAFRVCREAEVYM